MSGWCTIESDPGVFTELLSSIGVKGVQVEELYELDPSSMAKMKPVYGLIFLFKWQKDDKDNREALEDAPGVFFARQVVENACATQAILSVLLNRPDVELGDTLGVFKEQTKDFPPDIRGYAIGNTEAIRSAHNSFARPEPFVFDKEKAATEDDEVYHFIGYVPVDGVLYELDGLKPGPIPLGQCSMENWLEVAQPAIQERIQRYSAREIHFNLLALVRNKLQALEKEAEELEEREQELAAKRMSMGDQPAMRDDGEDEASAEELDAELAVLTERRKEVEEQKAEEENQRRAWHMENVRRRHNYVPFIYNLLRVLAQRGKLQGLVEEGQKVTEGKLAKKKEREEKLKLEKENDKSLKP